MTKEEIRQCLRNLIELCHPHPARARARFLVSEGIENLLEFVIQGKLKLIYNNGIVGFQEAEICEDTDKEDPK